MDLSINGLGGAFTPNRKPLPRRKKPAKPDHDFHDDQEGQLPGVEYDAGIKENSRAEIAGISQAIQATETAGSIVSAAQDALREVKTWLSVMENEAAQAAKIAAGGKEEQLAFPARQQALEKARKKLEALVESASFGKLRLLDGSLGTAGVAFGEGLKFISAASQTRSSSPEGYPVRLWQAATRAEAFGETPLRQAQQSHALRLAIEADGKQIVHYPRNTDSLEEVVSTLRRIVRENGLELSVDPTQDGRLIIRHMRYGSAHCFTLRSSLPGVFSMKDGRPRFVNNGRDVMGTINGESAFGEGQVLTGCAGNRSTDGLSVRFAGEIPDHIAPPPLEERSSNWDIGLDSGEDQGGFVAGRIIIAQQPLIFRFGPGGKQKLAIRLNSMRGHHLGLGVENQSGFRFLSDVRLGSPDEASDAVLIINSAQEEVDGTLNRLEEISTRVLADILAGLRNKADTISALYTNIEDAGFAHEVTNYLKVVMHSEAELAFLAQEQPLPGAINRLLAEKPAQG